MKAIILGLLLLVLSTLEVHAQEGTSFPSCNAPVGDVRVSYTDGIHGIVGEPGIFRGKDVVYTVDDNRILQCFCPVEGEGIQTNWLKVSDASQVQIQSFKNQGWTFIPSGKLWGLEDSVYFAKNSNFSCNDGVGGASTNPSVLGFAATGNIVSILLLFLTGAVSLFLAYKFFKNEA